MTNDIAIKNSCQEKRSELAGEDIWVSLTLEILEKYDVPILKKGRTL